MDVLWTVGLALGANVTATAERTDSDDIGVKTTRDVTGESTVKATLERGKEEGRERSKEGERERERELSTIKDKHPIYTQQIQSLF